MEEKKILSPVGAEPATFASHVRYATNRTTALSTCIRNLALGASLRRESHASCGGRGLGSRQWVKLSPLPLTFSLLIHDEYEVYHKGNRYSPREARVERTFLGDRLTIASKVETRACCV